MMSSRPTMRALLILSTLLLGACGSANDDAPTAPGPGGGGGQTPHEDISFTELREMRYQPASWSSMDEAMLHAIPYLLISEVIIDPSIYGEGEEDPVKYQFTFDCGGTLEQVPLEEPVQPLIIPSTGEVRDFSLFKYEVSGCQSIGMAPEDTVTQYEEGAYTSGGSCIAGDCLGAIHTYGLIGPPDDTYYSRSEYVGANRQGVIEVYTEVDEVFLYQDDDEYTQSAITRLLVTGTMDIPYVPRFAIALSTGGPDGSYNEANIGYPPYTRRNEIGIAAYIDGMGPCPLGSALLDGHAEPQIDGLPDPTFIERLSPIASFPRDAQITITTEGDSTPITFEAVNDDGESDSGTLRWNGEERTVTWQVVQEVMAECPIIPITRLASSD